MARISFFYHGILLSIIVLILFTLIFPIPAHPATFNVTNEDELSEALGIAGSNGEDDTINIAAGLYRTFGEPFTFESSEGESLTIAGEGVGKTVLDGSRSSQVLLIVESDDNLQIPVTVKSLTIQNGFSNTPNPFSYKGGALFIYKVGSVTIEDTEFLNNFMQIPQGGGLLIDGEDDMGDPSEVLIKNSIFISNVSLDTGGGAFIFASTTLLTGNSFISNIASDSAGGALVGGGGLTFNNNEFRNNSAGSNGGALVADPQGLLELTNNLFTGNITGGSGGGVYSEDVGERNPYTAVIQKNEFSENSANQNGGGAYVISGELYLSDNEFIGNSSGMKGGGLDIYTPGFNTYPNSIVSNNIIAFNTAQGLWGGGARFSSSGLLTLTNNTITGNTTDRFGSALVIEITKPSADNIYNIYNNIVTANTIENGSDILVRTTQPLPLPTPTPTPIPPFTVDAGTLNLFNNDVAVFQYQQNSCDIRMFTCSLKINEDNNINTDPMFVNPGADDFSLMPDSSCIDAGDPDAPDLPEDDIFGNPRGPIPDMGAVEYIAEAANNGGCSLSTNSASSSLAVIPALPLLIFIWRIAKKHKN